MACGKWKGMISFFINFVCHIFYPKNYYNFNKINIVCHFGVLFLIIYSVNRIL